MFGTDARTRNDQGDMALWDFGSETKTDHLGSMTRDGTGLWHVDVKGTSTLSGLQGHDEVIVQGLNPHY